MMKGLVTIELVLDLGYSAQALPQAQRVRPLQPRALVQPNSIHPMEPKMVK